jgi:hypothetical protein
VARGIPLIVLILAGEASCGGPTAKSAAPVEAGAPQQELVSFSASLTETSGSATGQLRLEVQIANIGGTPVNNVAVFEASVGQPGVTLSVQYALDPSVSSAPLAPGETRTFVFLADLAPALVGICVLPTTCEANPHVGVLSTSAYVLSSIGGWDIEADVPVTCAGSYPKVCPNTVADACQLKDANGAPLIHCVMDWADVLTDDLCGIAIADEITTCSDNYQMRELQIGETDYQFYYLAGSLVEIDSFGQCLGGPCGNNMYPAGGCYDGPRPFYTCDAGVAGDANTPDASRPTTPTGPRWDAAVASDANSPDSSP